MPQLIVSSAYEQVWPQRVHLLAFAPSGKVLAFSAREPAGEALYTVDPRRPGDHRLVYRSSQSLYNLVISKPDGQTLLLTELDEAHQPHFVIVTARGSRELQLPATEESWEQNLPPQALAPSGRFAILQTRGVASSALAPSTFWFFDLETGGVASKSVRAYGVRWLEVNGTERVQLDDIIVDPRDGSSEPARRPLRDESFTSDLSCSVETEGKTMVLIEHATGERRPIHGVPRECAGRDWWQWFGQRWYALTSGMAVVVDRVSCQATVLDRGSGFETEEDEPLTHFTFDDGLRWLVRDCESGLSVSAVSLVDPNGPLAQVD